MQVFLFVFFLVRYQCFFSEQLLFNDSLLFAIGQQFLFVFSHLLQTLHLIFHRRILLFQFIQLFILKADAFDYGFIRADFLLVCESQGGCYLKSFRAIAIHFLIKEQIILSRMWDGGKIQQPETSLFFYNSGKSYVATKIKRASNLKEIFKFKSKSAKSPKFANDESKFFNHLIPKSEETTIKNSTSERQRQTQIKKSLFKGKERTIANFTVFNPRLPNILTKQKESMHMKSLQLTEEQQEDEHHHKDFQKSEQLPLGRKVNKNVHLLISNKNFKSEASSQEKKREMFHFCNLELTEGAGEKKTSTKTKQKQVVRIRRKKAQNTISDWHVSHRKRISMFEIEGPQAFGINDNFQLRETSKKRYNIETIYVSELGSKVKKGGKRVPIKEREGSQQLGGWENKSDSSGEYF